MLTGLADDLLGHICSIVLGSETSKSARPRTSKSLYIVYLVSPKLVALIASAAMGSLEHTLLSNCL